MDENATPIKRVVSDESAVHQVHDADAVNSATFYCLVGGEGTIGNSELTIVAKIGTAVGVENGSTVAKGCVGEEQTSGDRYVLNAVVVDCAAVDRAMVVQKAGVFDPCNA